MPRYVHHEGRQANDMLAVLTFYGVKAVAFMLKNGRVSNTMFQVSQIISLHEEDYRRSYDVIDFMEEHYHDMFFESSFESYRCKSSRFGYRDLSEALLKWNDPTRLRKRFNTGYMYIAVNEDLYKHHLPEFVIKELTERRRERSSFNEVDLLCALMNEYVSRVVNDAAKSGDDYFCNHPDTFRFSRMTKPFEYETIRCISVEYPDSIANCKQEYGSNLNRVLDNAMRDMYKQWTIDSINDAWMDIVRHSKHQDAYKERGSDVDYTHSQTAVDMYYEYDCVTPKFQDGRKIVRNLEHDRYIKIVKDRHYAMRLIFEELNRDREQTLCKTSTPVDVYYENL